MAQSAAIQNFGFHQIVAYNPDTGEVYGEADIVGAATIGRSLEFVNQTGGSYADPTATNVGAATIEGSITIKEIPEWLFEVFNGRVPTTNAAETGGSVTAITNFYGTSVVDAVTGIASVGIATGEEANLAFGVYIVEAISATTAQVRPLNSVDFGVNQVSYADDTLGINTATFTITAATAVEVVDDNTKTLGLELTGGSGAIGMTIGDTAIFTVRPINSGSYTVSVGGLYESFIQFGLILNGGKSADGTKEYMQIYRSVGNGIPLSMTEKAYPEVAIGFQPQADPCNNGEVYFIEQIKPNATCA